MTSASEIAGIYSRTGILTANHATVITLLHNQCVKLIQLSLEGPFPKRKQLNMAQNILVQFERSLDAKNELARNFFHLYDYCYCRLESDSPESHRNALVILQKISDAFDALLHHGKPGGLPDRSRSIDHNINLIS